MMEGTSDYLWKACTRHYTYPGCCSCRKSSNQGSLLHQQSTEQECAEFGVLGTFVFLTLSYVGVDEREGECVREPKDEGF